MNFIKNKASSVHLLLLAIFSFHYNAIAQEVSGVVLDENRAPIAAAVITSYPSQESTISDDQGRFSLTVVNNDKPQYLIIKHLSFSDQRVVLKSEKEAISLEVILLRTINDLDEVHVFQPGILQSVINDSQSVTLIQKDFIAKNNTGTFSGALAALPGVNTMNVGVGIAKPMIRGMGFNRILVNNRGIKQEGQQWGADHGLEVDPFAIENVEVIKGPTSLLFGSDGLGGVINIKENDYLPEDGHLLQLTSTYQTNNGAISNSLAWKNKHKKWFFEARVTHQDYGDYTIPADEFTYAGFSLPIFDNRLKNTAGNELHVSAAAGYQSKTIRSSLRVTSFNQKAGIFTGAIGLPRSYNLQHQGEYRDIDFPRQENQHHMIVNNTTVDMGAHRLEIDLGYQRNVREELSFPGAHGVAAGPVNTNLALGLYLDTYTSNIRYEFNPNSKHQVLFGSQFQYMMNEKDGFEFLLPVFTTLQLGFFHYQAYDFSERWLINGGIRYDMGFHQIDQHEQPVYDQTTFEPTGDVVERTPEFDRDFNNISGAAGAVWKATKNHHLKVNLGNSFRFPTAIELSSNGVHHGNFRHEVGDQNLNAEKGYQVDFTYLHQSENAFLEVAAFYGYYKDYIYLAPTGNFSFLPSGGTLWQYRQNDALFNGFEISASYQFPFHVKTDLAVDFVQNLNLDSQLPLPLTPAPSVLSSIEYNGFFQTPKTVNNGYVFLSGRYNFEQNNVDRNETPTTDSFIINAGLGFSVAWGKQNIQCKISANNLLNVSFFNHISRYRLINLPEQGRNIVFSAQIPLQFK